MSKTFVDQVPPETGRAYRFTANPDGTTKIEDVTEYVQEGTAWGAADANQAMRKEDYDTDGDGIVDNSEKLGGQLPAYYAKASDMTTANTNITALQKAETVLPTSGTAPNYTVTDASVTSIVEGLMRTVFFSAPGTNATLNINGLGAKPVRLSYDKYLSPKAGLVVRVYYNSYSDCFFVVSPGGGVEFPATPAAGGTAIYVKTGTSFAATSTYAKIGAGWGFIAQKAGTYRVAYSVLHCGTDGNRYVKLQKNNVDISSTELTTNSTTPTLSISKTIDINLSVGDRVDLLAKNNNISSVNAVGIGGLSVSVLAADVQTEINTMVTATTT